MSELSKLPGDSPPTLHSEGQFGPQREFWWNEDFLRLMARCHRGRIQIGQGDHNLGDLLPGYFAQLGLRDIAVYQSDWATALFPPYEIPAQRAVLDQQRHWKAAGTGPFNREELRRLCLAGGRTAEFLERVLAELEGS